MGFGISNQRIDELFYDTDIALFREKATELMRTNGGYDDNLFFGKLELFNIKKSYESGLLNFKLTYSKKIPADDDCVDYKKIIKNRIFTGTYYVDNEFYFNSSRQSIINQNIDETKMTKKELIISQVINYSHLFNWLMGWKEARDAREDNEKEARENSVIPGHSIRKVIYKVAARMSGHIYKHFLLGEVKEMQANFIDGTLMTSEIFPFLHLSKI